MEQEAAHKKHAGRRGAEGLRASERRSRSTHRALKVGLGDRRNPKAFCTSQLSGVFYEEVLFFESYEFRMFRIPEFHEFRNRFGGLGVCGF